MFRRQFRSGSKSPAWQYISQEISNLLNNKEQKEDEQFRDPKIVDFKQRDPEA
jgi:hypothetical protein